MNNNIGIVHEKPGQQLVGQLLGFARYVRENHFNVGIEESVDCQRLAASTGITQRRQLQCGLKTVLCTSSTDWDRFDELFNAYWRSDEVRHSTRVSTGAKGPRSSSLGQINRSGNNGIFDVPDANVLDDHETSDRNMSHGGACAIETVACKDFNQLNSPAEMRAMEELVEGLARRIRQRMLRRQRLHQRGRRIDIRRTMRDSLRYGGLPLALKYRKRRVQIPKLVLLLDVSRSMSVYSHLFLRFACGILGVFKDSDAFAFHTRLVHIGEILREPSRRRLIEKIELISAGWHGGTRIGNSLRTFNRDYARKVLNSRSIVIVVSDGYDTGEPQALVEQLQLIKRHARSLMWLNPLLGLENYSPSTRCMHAALSVIDLFLPAHNLQSLAALETQLSKL